MTQLMGIACCPNVHRQYGSIALSSGLSGHRTVDESWPQPNSGGAFKQRVPQGPFHRLEHVKVTRLHFSPDICWRRTWAPASREIPGRTHSERWPDSPSRPKCPKEIARSASRGKLSHASSGRLHAAPPLEPRVIARRHVGVDGGATRCRARVRDADGCALGEATGAAANIHVDFAAAVAIMRAVVSEALERAGIVDRGRIAIGFGLAGLNDASDAERIISAFPGYALVRAANDATAACIGAHAGADGGLVIAGTGSAAIARVAGAETIVGGRGFALGDDGSGAHIGLDALRAATRAADGLAPGSPLTG